MHLQVVGAEYGTTTGRRRRCRWLDLVVLKHSNLIKIREEFKDKVMQSVGEL